MYLFNEYVSYRDMREEDEKAPPGVDPEMWAAASPRMRDYLRTQAAGQVPQAPPTAPEAPPTYKISNAIGGGGRVGRALGPVQGQTGQGLESIPAGGRVPRHLIPQIPPGDIAPGWEVATKFFWGKDGNVYKK